MRCTGRGWIGMYFLVGIGLMAGVAFGQGSLTPPGVPGEMMKTLDQIEPRIPISSAGYTVSQSGSYYLTTNLTATNGQTGIGVYTDNVTIDLNGFTLTGPGGSSGFGIYQEFSCRNLTVLNGKVVDFSGDAMSGIKLSGAANRLHSIQSSGNHYGIEVNSSILSDCVVHNNNSIGILVNSGSTLRDCIARDNGGRGFSCEQSTLRGCSAYGNNGAGIGANTGSTLINCEASGNSYDGISADSGSIVLGCTAYGNDDAGIHASYNCTIRDCTVYRNTGDGIEAFTKNLVTGNNCSDNGYNAGSGAGIHVTADDNRLEGNTVIDNDRGLEIDAANNYIADNTVSGNYDNYDIVPSNQVNILLCELPETIDWPARVKLAGTLYLATANSGITINANDITIDLAGHALIGSGAVWSAIFVNGSQQNITVKNGVVRGWGRNGLNLWEAENSIISGVMAYENSTNGISLGSGGMIENCTVKDTGGDGIVCDDGCSIRNCTVRDNGGSGIVVDESCTIQDCTLENNTGDGIHADMDTVISGCSLRKNGGDGIDGGWVASISRCTIRMSGEDGIRVTGNSYIFDNNCQNASNNAIHATSDRNRIDNNTVTDSAYGIYAADGNIVIRNTAADNATADYQFDGSTAYGPIVTVSGEITTNNPWANFSF